MASIDFLKLFLVAWTLLCSRLVSAHTEDPKPGQYCAFACYSAVDELTFNTTSDLVSTDYYTLLCSNTMKVTSIYYCAQVYCSRKESLSGVSLIRDICAWEASITLPTFEGIVTASADLSTVERVSIGAVSNATVFDSPVVPDADFFKAGYDTTYAYYSTIWLGHDFAYAFYGFWALVVLIGTSSRLIYSLSRRNDRIPSSKIWLLIRKHLILPATFGKACQEPIGWCTIPPRLESITLIVYVAMNIVFCFPGYNMITDNLYWPESKEQLSRYLSDRTGILAIANLPLVWLFATRNSPLLWLTGWSFATFNRFHRWVARMATALAVGHGIGYTIYSFYIDYYFQSWSEQYWYCGVMAVCCMTVILATSIYWLRQYHYELFLNVHIVLAVVCTAALFYHVKIFNGMYNGFLWPCVAIWAFDRALRLGKIAVNTFSPQRGCKTTAIATYNAGSDTMRIDITDYLRNKSLRPGSFYYVYAPSAGFIQAYESHPFTLCSWTRPSQSSGSSSPVNSVDFEKVIEATVRRVPSENEGSSATAYSFIIRPQSGMTRRLCKKIQASSESNSCRVPLLLEGPYGHQLDVKGFSDIMMIVGGVGICEAVTIAHDGITAGSTVRIIWAVRQRQLVDDVVSNELGALLDHPSFSLTAFITSGSVEGNVGKGKSGAAPYEVQYARPDIWAEMKQTKQRSSRKLAVISCGPGHLADHCRQVAVQVLGEAGSPMEYFNHSMGW